MKINRMQFAGSMGAVVLSTLSGSLLNSFTNISGNTVDSVSMYLALLPRPEILVTLPGTIVSIF